MIEYMKLFPEKFKKMREPSQGIDELCYYVALDKDLKQIQEVLKKENETDLLLCRWTLDIAKVIFGLIFPSGFLSLLEKTHLKEKTSSLAF